MKSFISLITGIVLIFPAAAQTDTLTLADCERLALSNNKYLEATRLGMKSADYTLSSAKANYLPDIYANAREIYSTTEGSFRSGGGNLPVMAVTETGLAPNGEYAYFPGMSLDYKVGPVFNCGLTVEQPIYTGGKITAGYRMAKIGTIVADLTEKVTEIDVIMETNSAYALLVKSQQMLLVAQKYNALLEELEHNVSSAVTNGMRPANDLLKVQVRGNEALLMLRRAENAISLAKMNLAHVIGIDMFSDIAIAGDIDVTEELNRPEYHSADITLRPEHLLLQQQIDYSEQKVKLLRGNMLPQIGVQLGYGYSYGIELSERTLLHRSAFNAILNVTVPITHFGERTNKVKAERHTLERLRMERDYKDEQMQLQLAQTIQKLDEAFIEAEIADRSLEQAAENMRLSGSQYYNGMEPLADYLEAQLIWQQAYQTRVDSRYTLYMSHLDYLRASGRLR